MHRGHYLYIYGFAAICAIQGGLLFSSSPIVLCLKVRATYCLVHRPRGLCAETVSGCFARSPLFPTMSDLILSLGVRGSCVLFQLILVTSHLIQLRGTSRLL